jgi:hypothetical protein
MSNSGRDAIEATSFKPAAGGGFVFRAPKPWLFGEAHNYLVDEAQKAEILTAMAPNVSALRRTAMLVALVLGPVLWAIAVATLMWAGSPHEEPTAGEMGTMIILIVVPVFAALYLVVATSAQATLAKLAPLIARLRPTEEQITAADLRRGIMKSMSLRAILSINAMFGASALIWAFALGMRVAQHHLFAASTVQILFNLSMSLVVIAIYSAMALRKAQEGRETATR